MSVQPKDIIYTLTQAHHLQLCYNNSFNRRVLWRGGRLTWKIKEINLLLQLGMVWECQKPVGNSELADRLVINGKHALIKRDLMAFKIRVKHRIVIQTKSHKISRI